MSDQVVLKATDRRKGAASLLPPSDIRAVSIIALIGGIALAIAGWLDVSLLWLSPAFGDPDWEFGTVGQTMDALPLATVGVILMTAGLRGTGGRRIWPRLLAVLQALVVAFLLVALVIFATNVGQAFRLLSDANAAPGLRRVIAKTFISGATYALLYGTMAVLLWRSTGKRAASETA